MDIVKQESLEYDLLQQKLSPEIHAISFGLGLEARRKGQNLVTG